MFIVKRLEGGRTLGYYKNQKECTMQLVLRSTGGRYYSFLLEKIFDPRYDFVYPGIGQDSRSFFRGNQSFTRPYGWYKKRLHSVWSV